MNGLQLTFYTQQDRLHNGVPIYQWLVKRAQEMNVLGTTVVGGFQGVGHDGKVHTVNWFDASEQPVRVIMVLENDKADALFSAIAQDGLNVFYTKEAVQYGYL